LYKARRRSSAGVTIIELVVFIIVFGLGIAALLMLYTQLTRASVDPMIRKQTLAIASSLLEEIELRPFTYCDPDSPNVYSATDSTAAECGGAAFVEGPGAEGGEARNPANISDPRFDNVSDYHLFEMGSGTTSPGIKTVESNGTASIAGLADYAVRVTVANVADLPPAGAADTLLITVTAQHVPSGVTVSLQGYRLRYAPNSP